MMDHYSLVAGDTRIDCGDTSPVYSQQRRGWVFGDHIVSDWDGTAYSVKHTVGPAALEPADELPAIAFYLAFKPQERIAIKSSQDAIVKEFWETYQLAATTGAPIHPKLVSVAQGIAYLHQVGILASEDRIAQILAGVPQ